MPKASEPVITVTRVFAGNQTDREAFIDLIRQRRALQKEQRPLDAKVLTGYTTITPKCGIHSGMERENEIQ